MSTTMVTNEFASSDNAISSYRGQIGAVSEQQRAVATIQAALTVAAARPRNEQQCMDRVLTSCQRVGLAEKAEYSFSRGGTEITGPTIDLMTVIANCWGNIDFGFREISQQNGESVVECFAWDLETNSKRTIVFTVPHVRYARGAISPLKDPRDIYELVANNAQRRVRACLEAVIPPDVVASAVTQCQETLKSKDPVTPEKIKKLVESFEKEFGVTQEQIETRLQRRVDTITSAQMISMKRIWKSLKDGMSTPDSWFKTAEDAEPEKGVSGLKNKLKPETKKPKSGGEKQAAEQPKAGPSETSAENASPQENDQSLEQSIRSKLDSATSSKKLEGVKREIMSADLDNATKNVLLDLFEERYSMALDEEGRE